MSRAVPHRANSKALGAPRQPRPKTEIVACCNGASSGTRSAKSLGPARPAREKNTALTVFFVPLAAGRRRGLIVENVVGEYCRSSEVSCLRHTQRSNQGHPNGE